jgi:hypothetical protein
MSFGKKSDRKKRNPVTVFFFVMAGLVILYIATMVAPGVIYGIFHMS